MPSTKTLNQSPTISEVENADLLWIWDSSASELNKISRTNLLTTTDDFNTSYARLAGRSGGQTLIGGTAANADLTLEGTSNSTRTTSYVVLQPNAGNVGIGTTSPGVKLEVNGQIRSYAPTGEIHSYSTDVNNTAKVFAGWISDDGMQIGYNPQDAQGYVENTHPISAGQTFGDIYFRQNSAGTMVTRMTIKADGGNVGIGTTSPNTRLDIDAGAIEFAEMTAPATGAVNTGRLFCRDNGSGKTQLCIIFSSGAIQVIATQP
jgi:hypothetical protein